MVKMLKKEMANKLQELELKLEMHESKPEVNISDVSIKIDGDPNILALAKAVEEGMKALQSIGNSKSYGIYIDKLHR